MKPYLIDGPLMTAIERRAAVLDRMATALVQCGEHIACDSDAMRVLHRQGYPMVDVTILAGEARMLAYQEIVSKEMATP